MSKFFNVRLPFTGVMAMTIEAADKEEAIEKAFGVDWRLKMETKDPASPEIEEIELHDAVTRGNVFYGVQNEAEAEEA